MFIQLLNCMIDVIPFIFIFFYCVYNLYTRIRSFAALQHLSFAGISLEFCILYWHMLPGLPMDISHDIWIYGFVTYHTDGKTRFTGFYSAYHCMLMLWWWLQLHVVNSAHIVCEIPWVVHTVYKLYTQGFIFFFWLCCAHIHSIVCYAPGFNSLCGFVPHLGVVNSPTKWVRRLYTCIFLVHDCTIVILILHYSWLLLPFR